MANDDPGHGPAAVSAELDHEQAVLRRADLVIAEGQERLERQQMLTLELLARGQAVKEAERLLTSLQQSLETWKQHRDIVRDRIAYLQAKLGFHDPDLDRG